MKRDALSGSFLLVGVALISIGITLLATGCANKEKAYNDRQITVLNPAISTKIVERVPLGPRLGTIEGKTLYLVDMQWGGAQCSIQRFRGNAGLVLAQHAVGQNSDKKDG
jgi:hypothetical protein